MSPGRQQARCADTYLELRLLYSFQKGLSRQAFGREAPPKTSSCEAKCQPRPRADTFLYEKRSAWPSRGREGKGLWEQNFNLVASDRWRAWGGRQGCGRHRHRRRSSLSGKKVGGMVKQVIKTGVRQVLLWAAQPRRVRHGRRKRRRRRCASHQATKWPAYSKHGDPAPSSAIISAGLFAINPGPECSAHRSSARIPSD
jgi:hypothetical protein